MTFRVGETVVYPHHGAAVIEEISTRQFGGEEKTYLTLRVVQGDLTIQVPVDNVEMVGVRDVVDEDGFQEVMETLRDDNAEEPSNWSRRYKANNEKIATGDIIRVAEVVRDLSRRGADKGLSAGEKRMLTKARQILTSELALARDVDEETANDRLDQILAENEDNGEAAEKDAEAPEKDAASKADAGDAAGDAAEKEGDEKAPEKADAEKDDAAKDAK